MSLIWCIIVIQLLGKSICCTIVIQLLGKFIHFFLNIIVIERLGKTIWCTIVIQLLGKSICCTIVIELLGKFIHFFFIIIVIELLGKSICCTIVIQLLGKLTETVLDCFLVRRKDGPRSAVVQDRGNPWSGWGKPRALDPTPKIRIIYEQCYALRTRD